MPITIVVADEHPVVLAGVTRMLRDTPDFRVLATCPDGDGALRAIRRHRPDVALLDIRMPRLNAFEVVREIRREGLATRVVLLTAEVDEEQTLEAVKTGIDGVILKDMAGRLLVECVRKVAAGGHWIERESLRRALDKLVRREAFRSEGLLTPSERKVLELVAVGRANRQIADVLHVSEGTVKSHLHNVYGKLEVRNRRELVERAREKGLI